MAITVSPIQLGRKTPIFMAAEYNRRPRFLERQCDGPDQPLCSEEADAAMPHGSNSSSRLAAARFGRVLPLQPGVDRLFHRVDRQASHVGLGIPRSHRRVLTG